MVKSEYLQHQCIDPGINLVQQSDPLDEPLDSPKVKWFTYGSSYAEWEPKRQGYATVSPDEVTEVKALPPQTSAQKTELTALMRALPLRKDKKLSIFTDSKWGFHVLHAHAVIWKEEC